MDGIKGKPGEVLKAKSELIIACGLDAVRVTEVQASGKSRMASHEWTRGRPAEVGDIFGEPVERQRR